MQTSSHAYTGKARKLTLRQNINLNKKFFLILGKQNNHEYVQLDFLKGLIKWLMIYWSI